MAVVAAKENTFVPGLGGGMIPRNNYTFVRRKPNIICEEVGAVTLTLLQWSGYSYKQSERVL